MAEPAGRSGAACSSTLVALGDRMREPELLLLVDAEFLAGRRTAL
jgi:hypothetical protein